MIGDKKNFEKKIKRIDLKVNFGLLINMFYEIDKYNFGMNKKS